MFSRRNQYLKVIRILVPEQSTYTKGISIENAIFTLLDSILTSLDHRIQTAGIFCDLTKVSDYVNHEILLRKSSYYGIYDIMLAG
jgi:hypothetical protein